MGMKLEIYPACLDCAWRDLRVGTIHASSGIYDVEVCDKAREGRAKGTRQGKHLRRPK